MDFVANQETQIKEMLASIGVENIAELYSAVPHKLHQTRPAHDDGLSEYEGMRHMESIAAKNTFPSFENYLGAGAYEHHVPVIVGAICSKSEFLTSYTPYQPEASQGMLQTIFEFQSAICSLTGMDVSNASVYDGASACAEALLMALRHHKNRKGVILAKGLHPHYRGVVEQYLCSQDVSLDSWEKLGETTAAVLIPYPNFFGEIEDIKAIAKKAHEVGALVIIAANPLVYGLYSSARELGADIAVGDCQPLGLPLQFGGPYAGYVSCRHELVRQLPGRIVGETVDLEGKKGYVLTLQAREQHIRREKATSNICTNQALAALASLIAILWYGKEGIKKLALTNYQRAEYLKTRLLQIPGITAWSTTPTFNEFTLKFNRPLVEIIKVFREHKIEPGLDLSRFFPEMKNCLLIAVTETKSKAQLDRYCDVAARSLSQ
jgi:glycine dehydrogenase subunit 1